MHQRLARTRQIVKLAALLGVLDNLVDQAAEGMVLGFVTAGWVNIYFRSDCRNTNAAPVRSGVCKLKGG